MKVGKEMKHVLIMIFGIAVLSGCSNFKSSKHVDMTPFAEHTVGLISDISYGLNSQRMVYLREYRDTPVVQAYGADWGQLRPVLRGVAAYSIAVVTLSKSNITDAQRNEQLATFLDKLLRPVIQRPESPFIYSEAEFDGILENIRTQKTYLNGLLSAQPIVDELARFSGEHLDMLKDHLATTTFWLDARILEDHSAAVTYHKILVGSQANAFDLLALLRDYRQGREADAIGKLLEKDRVLAELVKDKSNVTLDEVEAIENKLLWRLEQTRNLLDQIAPDLVLFRNKIMELDKLSKASDDSITKTRITMIIWSRAHQRLASGVTDPAKVDLMGIAQRALKASMPF